MSVPDSSVPGASAPDSPANRPMSPSALAAVSSAWRVRLSAYLDGECSLQERAAVESALEGARPLRRAFGELFTLQRALGHLPEVAVNEAQAEAWLTAISIEATAAAAAEAAMPATLPGTQPALTPPTIAALASAASAASRRGKPLWRSGLAAAGLATAAGILILTAVAIVVRLTDTPAPAPVPTADPGLDPAQLPIPDAPGTRVPAPAVGDADGANALASEDMLANLQMLTSTIDLSLLADVELDQTDAELLTASDTYLTLLETVDRDGAASVAPAAPPPVSPVHVAEGASQSERRHALAEAWRKLSPGERQEAQARYRAFRRLTSDTRLRVQKNFEALRRAQVTPVAFEAEGAPAPPARPGQPAGRQAPEWDVRFERFVRDRVARQRLRELHDGLTAIKRADPEAFAALARQPMQERRKQVETLIRKLSERRLAQVTKALGLDAETTRRVTELLRQGELLKGALFRRHAEQQGKLDRRMLEGAAKVLTPEQQRRFLRLLRAARGNSNAEREQARGQRDQPDSRYATPGRDGRPPLARPDRRPMDRRPGDRRPGDRRPMDRRPDDRRPMDRRPDDRRRPDARTPNDRRPPERPRRP